MLDLASRDRAFVIAEAGTCHAEFSDSHTIAGDYIMAAKNAGADAVKFQWFHDPTPETMFCWMKGDEERAKRWKASALGIEEWALLREAADEIGIMLLASTFEHETVRWLDELGIEATKVASRAAFDFPYEDALAPFLISTGMRYHTNIKDAIYLECEAKYPSTARWEGSMPGFSDHSGLACRATDAIALGCKLVEVHFYILPEDAGPDLPASLDLSDLKLVCDARDAFADDLRSTG